MKNKLLAFLVMCLICGITASAQTFITKAKIEYEVKSNIQKTMGNDMFDEMLKENLPTFKTGYFNLTFADNKSIYKFDHWDAKLKLPQWMKDRDEENVWFYDYTSSTCNVQKTVWGSKFSIADSLQKLNWKFTNENREIAGFNCRKAVATIFDSVYVFAYYTDEIVLPGGPISVNGLPGLILGLTIPRMFTSWIATKVIVNDVDESIIKPVSVKKTYSMPTMKETVYDRLKEWRPDENNEDEKQQKNRFVWGILL